MPATSTNAANDGQGARRSRTRSVSRESRLTDLLTTDLDGHGRGWGSLTDYMPGQQTKSMLMDGSGTRQSRELKL